MRTVEQPPSQGSLNVQDFLFIVFRHKWKILFLTLLGFGAAAAVFLKQEVTYKSEAKLLVHYVLERGAVDQFEAQMGVGGRGGEAVMNTEIEILTSQDLALDVAETIGPEKLIGGADTGADLLAGAYTVQGGLEVSAGSGSNVLLVSFKNRDREVARDALRELVTRYFDRHLDIHRSIGAFDFVTEKTDLVRGQLRQTETELNKLKAEGGIINLDESITNLGAQMAKTSADVLSAEAALAEQEARLKSLSASAEDVEAADQAANEPADGAKEREPVAPPTPIAIAEYDTLTATLGMLNQKKLELLAKYTPRARAVVTLQGQIDRVVGERSALMKKHPGLMTIAEQRNGQGPVFNVIDEKAKLAALIARSEKLKLQLKQLETEHSKLGALSNRIEELERQKQVEEEKFRYLESSLEKARADEALDPSKIPNISIVQRPTAAVRHLDDKVKKLVMGLAGSGLMLGLGLAFLIEMFLDRSVKRPGELESRLHIPLMLAIPYHGKGARIPHVTLENGPAPGKRLEYRNGEEESDVVLPDIPHSAELSLGEDSHFVLPYAAAIRDRIVYHMELNEMTHKPKLVALTGLSKGAGTTTVAAGLAKAFAEDGTAKVLLVDLNSSPAAANGSAESTVTHSLDSALQAGREMSFKEGEENLYLARVAPRKNGKKGTPFAPKHLYELMPELRSSEFDYIIFDMPPIGPTSPTVAMAGIMDQVLLILDAEKTNRDTLKRNYADLVKGRADVSCVFNKTRQRAPRWVEGAM